MDSGGGGGRRVGHAHAPWRDQTPAQLDLIVRDSTSVPNLERRGPRPLRFRLREPNGEEVSNDRRDHVGWMVGSRTGLDRGWIAHRVGSRLDRAPGWIVVGSPMAWRPPQL